MLTYIIIFLIAIGIIGAILSWIKDLIVSLFTWIADNIGPILGVAAVIGAGYLLGPDVVVDILIFGVIVYALSKVVGKWIASRNARELRQLLETRCLRLGYMTQNKWNAALPGYADKKYPEGTSFYTITDDFARRMEQQYIEDDESLDWLTPAVHFLTQHGMADIGQLVAVPSEGLSYTHSTPNEQLIYEAMEKLRVSQKANGKNIIEKVPLEENAVRQERGLTANAAVPEYYKSAFKINTSLMGFRKSQAALSMETEEFSLDDL